MLQFPESRTWNDSAMLDRLAMTRSRLDGLNRCIVSEACRRFLAGLSLADRCLEIGAGGGQLRSWLPEGLRARVVHSEPSAVFCDAFRQDAPDATLLEASVYDLPLDSESVAAVLGLCVLDALDDLAKARDEIQRVLKPGGHVIHFLDLGLACLHEVVSLPLASGQVVLPNVLPESPAASSGWSLNAAEQEPLGQTILQDLMLCDRDRLREVIQYLTATGHPAGAALNEVLHRLEGPPREVAREFMELTADLRQRSRFVQHFDDALRLTAGYPNLDLRLQPAASIRIWEQRLAQLFSADDGFEIQCSQLFVAREWRDQVEGLAERYRHFARLIGQVIARRAPDPLEIGECVSEAGTPRSSSQVLVESGVHVFVAVKR